MAEVQTEYDIAANKRFLMQGFTRTGDRDLDHARRHILDTLGALVIIERFRSVNQSGKKRVNQQDEAATSRIFYSAVKEICSSILETGMNNNAATTPASLLHDLFLCAAATKDVEIAQFDWMPECWAASIGGVEPNAKLRLLHEKELPKALKARRGGTMMHLGAVSRHFDASIMDAISTPAAARCKDSFGRLPLHWAAAQSCSVAMLDYVLVLNPEATSVLDKQGRTPIALVIQRTWFPDQVEMMKYLVRADPESCKVVSNVDRRNLFHNFTSSAIFWSSRDHDKERGTRAEAVELICAALLECVPKDYLLATDSLSRVPLYLLCGQPNVSANIMSSVLSACPDALRVPNGTSTGTGARFPVYHALASEHSSVENIKLLIDAYPEGVNLVNLIGCRSLYSNHGAMIALVKSHVEKFPDSVNKLAGRYGDLPLHYACNWGLVDVVKFLYEKYPDAVKHFSRSGRLPLHESIGGYEKTPIVAAAYEDVVRFLCKQYPQSANMKKTFGDVENNNDDDDNGPAEAREKRMTQTPIELAAADKLPVPIQRLLLRACPEADEQRLRGLNYDARREAMFVAFSARSRQQGGPQSMVWQLRRLMRLDKSMSLLKHVISYL